MLSVFSSSPSVQRPNGAVRGKSGALEAVFFVRTFRGSKFLCGSDAV